MSRNWLYVIVLPLLGAEIWAQFALHDQALTTLFAGAALAVLAVRWALGPVTRDETDTTCHPQCPCQQDNWQ